MWLRWFTGAVGFAVAGIALMVVAERQWRAGDALKWTAPASALLGAAIQLVWFDAATFMHAITGTLIPRLALRRGCHAPAGADLDSGLTTRFVNPCRIDRIG